MKQSAFLINTARGPVMDQAALSTALEQRRIAGAGLDVLEQEPPQMGERIIELPNVVTLPHMGTGISRASAYRIENDLQIVRRYEALWVRTELKVCNDSGAPVSAALCQPSRVLRHSPFELDLLHRAPPPRFPPLRSPTRDPRGPW